MLSARVLPPLPGALPAMDLSLVGGPARGITLVYDRGGVASDGVARSLDEQGLLRRALWLRPSPFDVRGDHLACSLDAAAERLHPRETSAVLVVEAAEPIGRRGALGALLGEAAAGSRPPTLVLSHRRPARWLRRIAVRTMSPAAATSGLIAAATDRADTGLAPEALGRLTSLAREAPALSLDVLEVARAGGAQDVADALERAPRARHLADRLTELLIARRGPTLLETLRQAVATGYAPPERDEPVAARPWLVALERGWSWLSPRWAPSLSRALQASVSVVIPATPGAAPSPGRTTGTDRAPLVPALIAGGGGPPLGDPAAEPRAAEGAVADGPAVLRVRMLGSFEVSLGGRRIEAWHGQRGQMLLKYLLARRGRSCPRDVLIDAFWPEIEPGRARNRLHVALSALRRSLRDAAGASVVEFHEGSYRINPAVRLDLDVDAFEGLLARARRGEREGSAEEAIEAYAGALALYRGDFLDDDLYEDWTVMPREALHSAYLDGLDAWPPCCSGRTG